MSQPLAPYLSYEYWRDILFADLHALSDKSAEEKRKIRDVWLRDFLYTEYQLPDVTHTGTVFFRSLIRDDYKGLFHAVINASGVKDYVIVEDYQTRSNPPKLNLQASQFMLENKDLYDVLDVEDPLDQACCFIRACKYGFILDHFRRMQFSTLVCFADMQPVEHLLARYFRAKGVTTVTMQHGLYVDYGDMDTVNVINYLHQPSEYFLSWGPDTSALIQRHHPGSTTVDCGKPLVFTADPPSEESSAQPYIAVFLDQKIFNEQNEAMLEIVIAYARQSNRGVRVRFHPSINKKLFLNAYPEIREQLHFTDADFVVGHTSSLIYEAIALGCRVFQFESDVPAILLPDSCRFRTLKELEARHILPQPDGLAERYFCAMGEASLRRYSEFFENVLKVEASNTVGTPHSPSIRLTQTETGKPQNVEATNTTGDIMPNGSMRTRLETRLEALESELQQKTDHAEYSEALKLAYKELSLGLIEELRHFVPDVQEIYSKIADALYSEKLCEIKSGTDRVIQSVKAEKEKRLHNKENTSVQT